MQHNKDTENRTENTPDTPDTEQTQYPDTCSAHNYRTYSFDLYHEYVAIKNSNTIEIYTISKENIQKTLITSLYSFDLYHLQQYIKKRYIIKIT